MTTQLNILFMAIQSRTNSNGEMPVYCRLIYKQRQKRFMIGCTVPKNMWDQSKQRAKGKSSQADTITQQIAKLVQKIYKAESDLLKQSEPFEVEDIVAQVQGKKKHACRTLMQLYNHRFQQMKKLEGIDYKRSTLRKYLQGANAVKLFLEDRFGTDDIALTKINNLFLQTLESYLKAERSMKLITVNKIIQMLKSIVNMAVDNGWLDANPFPGHRFKHDRTEVIFLTVDELEQLEQHVFMQPRLAKVRDIFLFSVYTGLHYIDAMSLTHENILKGVDGKEWIKYLRQKTDKWIHIPLLNKAKLLIEKFRVENGEAITIVPRFSNQKINSYLKEIADVVGINKPLTHKIARKTFGSILLYYNIPMKVVSELMGHSSVVITEKHYAQVELKRLGEAMTSVDALTNL
ncbi:MAG TPA: site-specific integrase [Chitinophagaceae bacterium]